MVRALPSTSGPITDQTAKPKANIDPKNVEKGLAKLVLTLVDLIRKLMEKQAIRRIEDDQLSSDEIEKVGNAFLLLEEKMEELKETFGLTDEDLNLDLGPLGDLL
ncbi:gas vesicle protein K [Ktedonospora formicarum]|uniref:gas vesicle protein K n=1 Tax=Ktedonospora formicarum TaxID=2778364 RepID=UPI003B75D22F